MRLINLISLFVLFFSVTAFAQTEKKSRYRIGIDLAHGQKFWNDPSAMSGLNQQVIDRVNYMTDEFRKTASSVDAELVYLKGEKQTEQLAKCDVLFIHIPSTMYTPGEVSAITKFINNGGSLFLVMDSDYWSTLKQTNVNDLLQPYGIQFGGENPDSLPGGTTKAGVITDKALKISYHGARIVTGGTPFCFNNRSEELPFGVYKELKNGGRVIAMGDGMASLYMTSWEGVNDYQCSEFMHDVFHWLLK